MSDNSSAPLPACCVEKPAFSWRRAAWSGAAVFGAYALFYSMGWLSYSPTVESATGLTAVFLIGIAASVSSCTAAVSGLVVAVSASAAKRGGGGMRAHALFNLGRLSGFAGFGALVGLLGQGVTLSTGVTGALVLLIAALMLGLGLSLLELLPRKAALRPPAWLAARIHAMRESRAPHVPFVLGALTFFLPCGFTQSMQLFALSTGSPLAASAIMLAFALGTAPALLGLGWAASRAKGPALRRLTQAAGVIVLVLALGNLQNGAALLGWNAGVATASDGGTARIADGEQVIEMRMSSRGVYLPDVLVVKQGVPVRWRIMGDDFLGCGDTLILRQFGVNARLKPGLNEITFTPDRAGQFTFSCSMGMIRGTMIVEST